MGIRDTIIKKKKANTVQTLYKHWLEEDAISNEDTLENSPLDVKKKLDDQIFDQYDFLDKQAIDIQDLKSIELDDDDVTFNLPARYIWQGVFVVSLLLIMLSLMFTVLITRTG